MFGLCSRSDVVWLGIWVEDTFPGCPQDSSAGHADSQEPAKSRYLAELGYCHIHSRTADRIASDMPENKDSASPDTFTTQSTQKADKSKAN